MTASPSSSRTSRWHAACGGSFIVVAATQRPSADIVPTSLRDIFGYRCAFRCTTEASSDIILGTGWARNGYTATTSPPEARGVGWLLAEGGIPRRLKGAYLTDTDITELVTQRNRATVARTPRRPLEVRQLWLPWRVPGLRARLGGWVEQLALMGRPVWTRTCRRCDTTEAIDTDDLDHFPDHAQEGHLS